MPLRRRQAIAAAVFGFEWLLMFAHTPLALGRRSAFFLRAAPFALTLSITCLARNFAMRSINVTGTPSDSGNRIVPFEISYFDS